MSGTLREMLMQQSWQEIMGGQDLVTVDAALATFREWLKQNGLVVVPREATHDQMTHAMLFRSVNERPPHVYDTAGVYRTMIAAAPVTGLE